MSIKTDSMPLEMVDVREWEATLRATVKPMYLQTKMNALVDNAVTALQAYQRSPDSEALLLSLITTHARLAAWAFLQTRQFAALAAVLILLSLALVTGSFTVVRAILAGAVRLGGAMVRLVSV